MAYSRQPRGFINTWWIPLNVSVVRRRQTTCWIIDAVPAKEELQSMILSYKICKKNPVWVWSCSSNSVGWVETKSLPCCTVEGALRCGIMPAARFSAFHVCFLPTHNAPEVPVAHCSGSVGLHTCARLQAMGGGGLPSAALLWGRDRGAELAWGTATARSCASPA